MAKGKMQLGATPAKLAIVGILAVTFVVVLLLQFGGFSSQPATPVVPRTSKPVARQSTSTPRPAPASARSEATPQRKTSQSVALGARTLPKISREDAAGYDPFAWPHQLRASAGDVTSRPVVDFSQGRRQAEREQALAELRKHEVSAIFQSGTAHVAMIANKTVRVGDLFQGFRVTAIEADGISLEEQDANVR